MKIYRSLEAVRLDRPAVTLGFFDGVHLGHQALLSSLQRVSAHLQAPSLLITLWPHPRIVLGHQPERLQLINTLEYKTHLLSGFPLDGLLVLNFTLALASLSAERFLEMLVRTLSPRAFLMGYDHRFGAKGQGDFALLQSFARSHGIEAYRQDALLFEGLELSSTLVRREVGDGHVEQAARLMGRPFAYCGRVVRGRAIGRTLGYPTANVVPETPWQLLPGHGVYQGICTLPDGTRHHALINVGTRPSVAPNGGLQVEAHLLDFRGDLYDATVEVEFHAKVREEIEFPSLEALQQAITRDVAALRSRLPMGDSRN